MPEQLQRDIRLLTWGKGRFLNDISDDFCPSGRCRVHGVCAHCGALREEGRYEKNAVCVKRGILRDLLLKPVKYSVSRVDSNEEPRL